MGAFLLSSFAYTSPYGITRALAALEPGTPSILILDESLASLDLSVQAQMINLLVDLQERHGLAYILIAHDLRLAAHLADEVAVMFEGRMVERGSPAAVFTAPSHPHTAYLLAAVPTLEEPAQVPMLRRYLLRRLGHIVFLLAGISALSFVLLELAPGDFLGEAKLNPQLSAQTIAALREHYGLNKSLPQKYVYWLGSV